MSVHTPAAHHNHGDAGTDRAACAGIVGACLGTVPSSFIFFLFFVSPASSSALAFAALVLLSQKLSQQACHAVSRAEAASNMRLQEPTKLFLAHSPWSLVSTMLLGVSSCRRKY